jgi:hypothetical protein
MPEAPTPRALPFNHRTPATQPLKRPMRIVTQWQPQRGTACGDASRAAATSSFDGAFRNRRHGVPSEVRGRVTSASAEAARR